ncbi:MAG: YihY/virulence factor BrkB family protein [Terriglobales bacterium]
MASGIQQRRIMRFEGKQVSVKQILVNAWNDVMNNHIMNMAAGLSYYFVLSLFPLLVLAAAVLAYLPIPNLFENILNAMAHVVPAESMGLVRRVVATVVTPRGGLLTFGIIGTLWTASSGFAGLIEALNVAYNVPETRPIWRTRLLALQLMFVAGALLVAALVLQIAGPLVVGWLKERTGFTPLVQALPVVQWVLSVAFTIIGVESLFFWAPNVRQRFKATLPGAVIGVGFFIGSSYVLGLYFQNYANFNKTYGTLGAAIALLVWLYYSWFAILVGAEINSELVRAGGGGTLELKQKPPAAVKPVLPYEERPAA